MPEHICEEAVLGIDADLEDGRSRSLGRAGNPTGRDFFAESAVEKGLASGAKLMRISDGKLGQSSCKIFIIRNKRPGLYVTLTESAKRGPGPGE